MDGKYDRRRGSPTSDGTNVMHQKRAETYLKEGNAEILRLRTENHHKQGAGYSEQLNQNLDTVFSPPLDEAEDKAVEILPRQEKQGLISQSNSLNYLGHFVETENKTNGGEEIVDVERRDFKDKYPKVVNGLRKANIPKVTETIGEVMQRQSSKDQVRVRRHTQGDTDIEDGYKDHQEETLQRKPFNMSPHLSRGANISESINYIIRNRVEDESKPPVESANISESINEILRRPVEDSRQSLDSSSSTTASRMQVEDSRLSIDSLTSLGANARPEVQEGSSKLTRQPSKDSDQKSLSQPTSHSSSAGVLSSGFVAEISPMTDKLIEEILDDTQPARKDQEHKKSISVDNSITDEQDPPVPTQNGDVSSKNQLVGEKSEKEWPKSHLVQQDNQPPIKDIEQESAQNKFSTSEASKLSSDRLPSDVTGVVQKVLDLQPQMEQQPLATVSKYSPLIGFHDEVQQPDKDQGEDTISLPGSLSMATQTDRHQATQTDLLCLLRPEPRRTKSENDDSSDSEPDGGKNVSLTVFANILFHYSFYILRLIYLIAE